MAVTAKIFSVGLWLAAFNEEIDLLDDTIKVILTTDTFVPDQDVHNYHEDITNEVANGNGYATGGATLANDTFAYTAGTNVMKYDADDATWAASTITAARAIVYDDTPGTSATKPLICYQSSDSNIVSTGGTFTVAWHADGIFSITTA